MTGNGHVRFGGGPPQKYCPDEGQQLGGGLPNHPLGAWLDNTVRHEAPCNRAEMRGLRRRSVAAGR